MAPSDQPLTEPRTRGDDAKACPHCGTLPPVAHNESCIAPKLQLRAGDPRPSAETLTQWREACLAAFPERSHDGFCSPVSKSR
jgi:hypothetical protein